MAAYLSFKEIWRNKGRYLLFSLVIALITVLVLFTAGLGEGLASANKEYLEKINADLLVFQEDTGFSTLESRLEYNTLKQVRRWEGVADVGAIGFSNVTILFKNGAEPVEVSLIGVEPGKPGAPPAFEGEALRSKQSKTTVIDGRIAEQANVQVGDTIIVKTTQGAEDEFYELKVSGITDGRQYFFQPSVFVPLEIWDEIRPKADTNTNAAPLLPNILAIQLQNPDAKVEMGHYLESRVDGIETADIKTTYEAAPGYAEQQSTLNTMKGFTFLIGVLVIGGFFQIQTLQKVAQIGMLKAIGTSNHSVANAAIFQIIFVTIFGVAIGGAATLGMAFGLPSGVPIVFTGTAILIAVIALLLIGPIGGLVSIRMALKVEPLRALGM
ncbi:MAG: ABC transporter permease [Chloroflexi bacterium]|nr:ABC transporter permease [Chloroflexota bacterium]